MSPRKRRIRLTGGETPRERAVRLARVEADGWAERVGRVTGWQREARRTGFVAGYLACLEDEVPAPPAEVSE
jgi:hypothetical protein